MRLFVFGLGYSTLHFIARNSHRFTAIAGTVRTEAKRESLRGRHVEPLLFNATCCDPSIETHLAEADLLLLSVPPGATGDPVLATFGKQIAASPARRVIYLSTVGVYRDHAGAWIDETADLISGGTRRGLRVAAERAWCDAFGDRTTILRLAGIYGPGRNPLLNLRVGKAHRIVKAGQVFNRIHVDDISQTILAAVEHPDIGIWNVCDDEPAPPQDVVTFAAALIGIAPPAEQAFETAEMSEMARSFYATSNRISNARLKRDLKLTLAFPDYRKGLAALWAADGGR